MWKGALQQRDRYKGIQSDTNMSKRGMEQFREGCRSHRWVQSGTGRLGVVWYREEHRRMQG